MDHFRQEYPRYTGSGRGGHNMPPDKVKSAYIIYTKEDYGRSGWSKLLRKLEDNPVNVKLNLDFV